MSRAFDEQRWSSDPRQPYVRVRITRADDSDNIEIVDEVMTSRGRHAQQIDYRGIVFINRADAIWLRDALTKLLEQHNPTCICCDEELPRQDSEGLCGACDTARCGRIDGKGPLDANNWQRREGCPMGATDGPIGHEWFEGAR